MGRSVSRPTHSVAVAYEDVSALGHDEDGEWDSCLADFDWQEYVENIRERSQDTFPTMAECDLWLDREDHAIMENTYAYIGISEYCGLACIWLVCKADYRDIQHTGLARAWCDKAANKFNKTFGDLVRLGTMSNGESVYQKKGG